MNRESVLQGLKRAIGSLSKARESFLQRVKKAVRSHQGREWKLGVALFMLAWGLSAVLCFAVVKSGAGAWIELFNGATWPPMSSLSLGPDDRGGLIGSLKELLFYVIVGLRTLLNLGIVLSAAFVLYLLSTGQMKELLMSKLESVLNTRDTALAAFLIHKMKNDGKFDVPPELRDRLYAAAKEFRSTEAGRRFWSSVESAMQASKQQKD